MSGLSGIVARIDGLLRESPRANQHAMNRPQFLGRVQPVEPFGAAAEPAAQRDQRGGGRPPRRVSSLGIRFRIRSTAPIRILAAARLASVISRRAIWLYRASISISSRISLSAMNRNAAA